MDAQGKAAVSPSEDIFKPAGEAALPSGMLRTSREREHPWVDQDAASSGSVRNPAGASAGVRENEGRLRFQRVSTGISDLDALVEGGFLAGKSYLLAGEPGTGKTIFCTQFVLKGLLDGEKAVYVAVDDKPTDIVEQASSLGWDLGPYLESRQLLILDASPFFHQRVGPARERDIDVVKTVSDLGNYVKRTGASRVVVDPVGPLIASGEVGSQFRENARLLVRSFQDSLGTTNLFTVYAPTSGTTSLEGDESPFTGVIVLRLSRKPKGLARTLLVRKMRGTAFDLVEYQIEIVGKQGIVMGGKAPETLGRVESGQSLFREWPVQ